MQIYLPYCLMDYSNFLIANSPYSPLAKNPSSFFNFGPLRRPNTLSFRGLEHSPNFQFLCAMLTAWCYVVDVVLSQIKKDRWAKFSFFWSLKINKRQNQEASWINLQITLEKDIILFQYPKRNLQFLTTKILKLHEIRF